MYPKQSLEINREFMGVKSYAVLRTRTKNCGLSSLLCLNLNMCNIYLYEYDVNI